MCLLCVFVARDGRPVTPTPLRATGELIKRPPSRSESRGSQKEGAVSPRKPSDEDAAAKTTKLGQTVTPVVTMKLGHGNEIVPAAEGSQRALVPAGQTAALEAQVRVQ